MAKQGVFVTLDKGRHCRESFSSGKAELDRFLKDQASRHMEVEISRTYLLPTSNPLENGKLGIRAFYTIAPSTVSKRNFPRKEENKLPLYPVPVLLIAQLAVHQDHQHTGIGKVTLVAALRKAHSIAKEAAFHSVVVDCLDQDARGFYEKFGFKELCIHNGRVRLFLPMGTVKQLFSDR